MAYLEKLYREKLEQIDNLRKDLNELRKKGKQYTDESMKNKLEQLRQLMDVADEQLIATYDDESLDCMISKLNSELQCLGKLLEGRPVITTTDILENASGGLALRGILVGEAFSDDCVKRIVLSAPTDVKLRNPLMTQVDKVENFSSKLQSDYFHRALDTMGYSAAVTMKGGRFGFNAEADFSKNYEKEDAKDSTCHRQDHFESRVMFSVVPTAACELNEYSLKFSQQALQELKSIDTLLVGSENLELVYKKCEAFLTAYGSHINAGVLHFGGVNKFVATYTSETESKSDKIKGMVRDALSAYASASHSAFVFSFGGSVSADQIKTSGNFAYHYEKSEQAKTILHTTRNGGPQEVNALHLWKIGLVTCNSTWALIDRGGSLFTDFVGIWKLIPNHKGEFEEPYQLETSLMTVWERMSGYLGSIDQERTFMKGHEEIDLLIEKIAMWNNCPTLPAKCINYLQEILKTIEEVEAQTKTTRYWVNKLCTEVNISSFLTKVVELRDKLDPKDVSIIRYLIRKLVNHVEFREFPGKHMLMKWATVAKTEDIPSLLTKVHVKNIPDLITNLTEKFIPALQIEHAENIEKNVQVTDAINAGATVDMALCVSQLLKDLQSSGEEHEMFFLKVALLPLYYDWPTMRFETLLTMEKLQDFVQSVEVYWKEFQVHKEKGKIQLEAFIIHTSLSSGHFDEVSESSENEFSEAIKELRQVLSPQLNDVLNRYATCSPFNWIKMTNVTGELASGNMSSSEEEEVNIAVLQNMASSEAREKQDGKPVMKTNFSVEIQGDFSDILKSLGLDKYYSSKISLLDAIAIKRDTEQIKLNDVPWMIIHNLLMINFNARDQALSVVNKPSREDMTDGGGYCDMETLLRTDNASGDEEEPLKVSTLDALVATFTCCNNFLKQILAQKLFVCKLAIPFLYPIGSEDNIGMSLWALRTITVQWHNEQKEASDTPVTEKPIPLVSFVRLGRPPLSKSKLMNDILRDDSHDTFFHHDCNNGTTARRITDGLVECSWFITSGKEKEHLPSTTMFLNLRGDASLMKRQLEILQKFSSVLFVIVTAQDLAKSPHTETCQHILHTGGKVILFLVNGNNRQIRSKIQVCLEVVGKDILKGVPIIVSSTMQDVDKNASELKDEARGNLAKIISMCCGKRIKDCAESALKMGVVVDEYDDEACRNGKALAENVVSHMAGIDIEKCKDLLLPLQGAEWIEYCKLLKKQHRSSSPYQASQVKQKMDHLREKQLKMCNRLSPFIEDFVSTLEREQDVVMYFLKWVTLFLDEKSGANLPGLRRQYHELWTQFQEAKKEDDRTNVKRLKSEVDDKENQLSSASLGLENVFRELGQIYEAVEGGGKIEKATRAAAVEYLPGMAAELLLKGIPLELVDGDASSVPIAWITAVLKKLGDLLGPKRFFVLSVLGIQSSGKSTLLNTMFGLQFAVSAGRCTRGTYMQLIPVDGEACLSFDYVAVIDTEGLRAPELGQLKYAHDNELATLVIGLGDVTMINIKGENTAEMKDILQIAVHAYLRMNLVSKNIRHNRSCIFVHQNVPAADAEELMMHGCQKLQESLDEMATEAALSESIADIHSFSQIINFDVQKHVWYFSDLWHGDPPMAPANPGYSEKVVSVKINLLGEMAKGKMFLTASELSLRLDDLWTGVLADDFVFSFRNSLEVKAYNSLQSKYYNLEWELQNKSKSWTHAAEIKLKRCEKIRELDKSYELLNNELSKAMNEKAEDIRNCLNNYFENCDLKEIIIQWQESKLNQLSFAVEQQVIECNTYLRSVREARRVEILHAETWSSHEEHIMKKAVELADELNGKEADNTELEEHFDAMWVTLVNKLPTNTVEKELNMVLVMEEILRYRLHAHRSLLKKELKRHPLEIPLAHTLMESILAEDFVTKDHISLKTNILKTEYNSVTGSDQQYLDARKMTVVLTDSILKEISTYLKGFSNHDAEFQKPYATEVIKRVMDKIDTHNKNAQTSEDYTFTIRPEYSVQLTVHVSRHCVQVFSLMQSSFNKKHGVGAKLQDYKRTAWSLFKNKVKQSTEEVIAGDLLCTHLKKIVKEAVKKAIPRKCTEEVLRDFQMLKYYLMVKLMDDLAVKGNFKDYNSYIKDAKGFALQWIIKYTDEKMFSRTKTSGISRYAEIAQSNLARIMRCVVKSVHHATVEVSVKRGMRMALWIEKFCQGVSEELAIPVSTLNVVRTRLVMDFNNLQRIIVDQLYNIQADLEKAFAIETKDSVDWDGPPPPQQIIDRIWGCTEQCPFCEEPCADTTPHHYDLSGKSHMCVQHRPGGIGGEKWMHDGVIDEVHFRKGQLCLNTCNYCVQNETVYFMCGAGDYKCRKSGKCSPSGWKYGYHKFTEYKTYIPDWDIAPDRTNNVSIYWMWFMATYQHQLKDLHHAELPNIPESWKKITKAEALADLRKIHH